MLDSDERDRAKTLNNSIVSDKDVSAFRRLECDAQAGFCHHRVKFAFNWTSYLANAREFFAPKQDLPNSVPHSTQQTARSIQIIGWAGVSFRQQRPGLLCEGIVSKRLGSLYRSGRSPHWIKVKNPNAPAVKREAEEDWGEREMRPRKLSPKFISTALLLIAVFPQHRRKAIGTMAITVSNRGLLRNALWWRSAI